MAGGRRLLVGEVAEGRWFVGPAATQSTSLTPQPEPNIPAHKRPCYTGLEPEFSVEIFENSRNLGIDDRI